MTDVRRVSLDVARAVLARAALDQPDSIPTRLGVVTLREHQRAAAARLASLIAANGGAMLAEPVGLGKTYTALAVAARGHQNIVIAAPASLRRMWTTALADCGITATIVTHEALSRGVTPTIDGGLIIVDEAHRVRSSETRRYAALAESCRRAKVLLVTATPVQNRRADLAAQLALFLGRAVWRMTDEELARYVVRGGAADDRAQPRLSGPHRVTLAVEDDCLDALLALPPPIPARDETLAVALLTYGLVHQWSSSRAALVAPLGRRRARGLALLAAVDAGRRPTHAELAAWTHAEDVVQLAFPELVTADVPSADVELAELARSLHAHDVAVEALLARLRTADDPDIARAKALLEIRNSHPGERIIAFAQYTETVHALRALLSREPGVAALTARGARVAGGRMSRDEIIAQFTPRPLGAPAIDPTRRVDLLITTDLLSEGLNLQEASIIVHLDLPWNPARLDQRVGRARRLGSKHDVVSVYTIVPPASAERVLQIESRLREKLGVAQRTIGVAGRILPSPLGAEASVPRGWAEHAGAVNDALRSWLRESANDPHSRDIVVAVARRAERGFLALVRDGDTPRLVTDAGAGIELGPAALERAIAACTGAEGIAPDERVATVVNRLRVWLAGRAAAATIDFRAATAARSRRAALARVARALARAPRHQRSRLAPLAAAARAVASAPMGEGAERILEMLVDSELSDEAWLRSIATFSELNARPHPRASHVSSIVALILFEPG